MATGKSTRDSRGAPRPYSLADRRVIELREILSRIYITQEGIINILRQADLNPGDYNLQGRAHLIWGELLVAAYNSAELEPLLDAIEGDRDAKNYKERIQELRGPSPVVEAQGDEEIESEDVGEPELILGAR